MDRKTRFEIFKNLASVTGNHLSAEDRLKLFKKILNDIGDGILTSEDLEKIRKTLFDIFSEEKDIGMEIKEAWTQFEKDQQKKARKRK